MLESPRDSLHAALWPSEACSWHITHSPGDRKVFIFSSVFFFFFFVPNFSLTLLLGGVAAEVAAVLDVVREDCAHHEPSLQRLENICHAYDLGTELGRFRLRVSEVFSGLACGLPRELLKGLFDMTSEAAWWLIQAYSREELKSTDKESTLVILDSSSNDLLKSPDSMASSASTTASVSTSSAPGPMMADASTTIYWESTDVLKTFQTRCMDLLLRLTSSLATTPDTAVWTGMIGKNCGVQLLRELELGANDPSTRELGSRLFLSIEMAFDQYSGLRQISDFRGLPVAPFALTEAVQLMSKLHELTMVAALQTLENLELVDEATLAGEFESLCMALVAEYHAFKDGVLLKLGVSSSLREMDRSGRTLNASVVLEYVRDVMAACDTCVEQMTTQFNERVRQIEFLPPAKQAEVFAAMGGKSELAQRVRAHLFQIKPWARESIQVQTQSMLQREVFGKTREEIQATLTKSREQMLEGFQALVDGRMPEPLNRLAEIISHMDEILEPLFAKKSGLRRGGKTGKLSKGKKSGKSGSNSSLAFSGMTIRGNMFQGAAEEFLNEQTSEK